MNIFCYLARSAPSEQYLRTVYIGRGAGRGPEGMENCSSCYGLAIQRRLRGSGEL